MRFQNVLERSPQIHYIPDFDPKPETPWYGIKALWYEGAPYQSQKTKVFAHIGFPEEAKTRKVPAVVLVHGGGGHAYPEWIRLWNEKGFAAIAMQYVWFRCPNCGIFIQPWHYKEDVECPQCGKKLGKG